MGEVRGNLEVKASNGKGFKVSGQDGWFNATDAIVSVLGSLNKGDDVIVTFFNKGVSKNVTAIVKAGQETTAAPNTGEFKCTDCGKVLKNDSFKKCFMCNKKNPKPTQTETATTDTSSPKKSYNQYDNPEKTAQIQRGNAINAAAASVSGNLQGADPDTISEVVLSLAQNYLDWLRAE